MMGQVAFWMVWTTSFIVAFAVAFVLTAGLLVSQEREDWHEGCELVAVPAFHTSGNSNYVMEVGK